MASRPTQTTVIGQMIGQLTGFVAAIAMAYLCYSTIMQIHRGAETSRLLGSNMTGMFIVRLGFAAIMMFPVPTSASASGRPRWSRSRCWGDRHGQGGLHPSRAGHRPGRHGGRPADDSRHGDNRPRPDPQRIVPVPGQCGFRTRRTPRPSLFRSRTAVLSAAQPARTRSSAYSLSVGNVGSTPACGTVTIPAPLQGATNLAGVAVDQSAIQQQALTTVLSTDIAPQVRSIATNFFNDSKAPRI